MKELIDHTALKVTDKMPRLHEAPTHGFNYDDWVALLDDEESKKTVDAPKSGIEYLRSMLLKKNINPDRCAEEVLEQVHDYISETQT